MMHGIKFLIKIKIGFKLYNQGRYNDIGKQAYYFVKNMKLLILFIYLNKLE